MKKQPQDLTLRGTSYKDNPKNLKRLVFFFSFSFIHSLIMRIKVLIALFIFLILMGILGFAPIHIHEQIDDKILHFSVFFVFAIFLYFLWDLSVKRNLMLATGIFLIVAVGSEFIQGLLPVNSNNITTYKTLTKSI